MEKCEANDAGPHLPKHGGLQTLLRDRFGVAIVSGDEPRRLRGHWVGVEAGDHLRVLCDGSPEEVELKDLVAFVCPRQPAHQPRLSALVPALRIDARFRHADREELVRGRACVDPAGVLVAVEPDDATDRNWLVVLPRKRARISTAPQPESPVSRGWVGRIIAGWLRFYEACPRLAASIARGAVGLAAFVATLVMNHIKVAIDGESLPAFRALVGITATVTVTRILFPAEDWVQQHARRVFEAVADFIKRGLRAPTKKV
ncbi:MAG: hypothetical protein AAF628_37370 [Planctomycetota bacterium]